MEPRPLKKLAWVTAMGLLAGLLAAFAYLTGPPLAETLDGACRDAFFRLRGPLPLADERLAQVAVGERSLDEVGRWPWPRATMAALLEAIADGGAKAVGLDVGFFEPAPGDEALAEVVTRHRQAVALGFFLHMNRRDISHLDAARIRQRLTAAARFAYPVVRFADPEAMDLPLISAAAPENNTPAISRAARHGGYFNIIPDHDGMVRRLALVIRCGDEYFPSLALVTLARLYGAPLPELRIARHGLEGLRLGNREIPVDQDGRMLINFRGGAGASPRLEACDVLAGRLEPGALAGRAVVVSVPATGVMDHRPTPFEAQLPGGDILLQAMDTIASGDFLVRRDWTYALSLAAIMALALLAALAMGYLPPLAGTSFCAGLALAHVVAVYQLFLHGVVASVVYAPAGLLLAATVVTIQRYRGEQRQRRFIRRAFRHYLSPAVIKALEDDPGALSLGGRKQELTVLFLDVRGFTAIAESLEPEVLSRLLNGFLDSMTRQVFAHQGVLDKFIGDAVMAFFGAPAPQPDHVTRACATALAMVRAAAGQRPLWQREGAPGPEVSVGLHSGPMIVGNMGSSLRFDYTVIGDNVNLGSRLEGVTRHYGVNIIASGRVRREACGQYRFRALDLLRVKGRAAPVEAHELLGPLSEPAPPWLERAEEAFTAYLARDFGRALAAYQAVLALRPDDNPSLLMARRCRDYLDAPPGPDWDGATEMSAK